VRHSGVLEKERHKIGRSEPTPEAPPGREPRLGQTLGTSTSSFVASKGVKKCGRPNSDGPLVVCEISDV
jgi:hypothetical protein